MKNKRHILEWLTLLVLAMFNTQISIASAQGVIITNWNTLTNWTQTSALTNVSWCSIASSANGDELAAVVNDLNGRIWTSFNAGLSWTQTSASNEYWASIASSADGTKLAAAIAGVLPCGCGYVAGGIGTSTNAGVTWSQTSVTSNNLDWAFASIASSADGTKLAAVSYSSGYYGGIWTSTNAGATWTSNSAPNEEWNSIASSSDGAKLAAVPFDGGIYTSTNAGVTWAQTSAPVKYWLSIACSSDGTRLAAVIGGGDVYTSTNAGLTWTRTSAPNTNWDSVTSSSDGTKLAAVAINGGIWTSTNGGMTWTQTSAPSDTWQSIASSADGTKLAAVAINGGIWTAQATIQTNAPRLTISYSGNSVMVWWPTNGNYTLQQNSNLAASGGWTTSGYHINTANGTNSVTVTPPAGSLFFRLAPP